MSREEGQAWGIMIILAGTIWTIGITISIHSMIPHETNFLILGYVVIFLGFVLHRVCIWMKPKKEEVWGDRMMWDVIYKWPEKTVAEGACPSCTKAVDPHYLEWESPSEFRCNYCNELIVVKLVRKDY